MWKLLAATSACCLITLLSCSDGGKDAKPGPLPTPGYFGIEAVDSAIAAIQSDDPVAVLELLLPTEIDCDEDAPEFSESPSCLEAVNGRLVDVFPLTNCDFRYVPLDEAERKIRGWLEAGSGPEVYGVFPAGRSAYGRRYQAYDGPWYAVVLRTILADRVAGLVLVANEEGVVGFSSGCQQAPDAVVGTWRFSAQTFALSQRTPTPSPTPLPTPPLTGIAAIDAAIDAIQHQDADALVNQMRMTLLACESEQMGLSIFPFCESEPDDTLVESFPIATCEGAYRRIEHSGPAVRRLLVGADVAVFAVFATKGTRFEESFYSRANPAYVIVIERSQGSARSGVAVLIDDSGLVGSLSGCADTPESIVSFWDLTDAVVLPPAVSPTATPLPNVSPQTGIGPIDRVIAAVEKKDGDALAEMARLIEVPCKREPPFAPYPACSGLQDATLQRVPDGTLVDAFPASFCSQHYLLGAGGLRNIFRLENDLQLFAVYPTTGSLLSDGFFSVVGPEYVVLLRVDSPQRPRVSILLLDGEAIVGYGNTCELSFEDYILGQNLTDPIILPPQDR